MVLAYKYAAPLKDIRNAFEAAGVNEERYNAIQNIEVLRDQDRQMSDLFSQTIAPFAENTLRPIYDNPQHVKHDPATNTVTLPDGYKEAYEKYAEHQIFGLTAPEKDGGLGLPKALGAATAQVLYAANNSFQLTHALTSSVCAGLHEFAADADLGNTEGKLPSGLRDAILKQLVSGQSNGLMVMTESGAGSDLQSSITTKATQLADGRYNINGTKIFITGGDDEYTLKENDKNKFHLVLVKIGDDQKLSLMMVPKFPVDENGKIKTDSELSDDEKQQHVYVSSVENKTGMEHSATTVMNYDNAVGYLVGERGSGMKAMFSVMNEARRAIGRQTLGIAEIASQMSFRHATNERDAGRRQGRATNGAEDPANHRGDPIVVHPAVREMLLKQRSFVEGARILDLMTEMEADMPDPESKQWVSLLTNMQKYHFTEQGYKTTDLAVQIYGGSGYIKDTGIEQFGRDARVTRIYEGTNQIQAISLVGKELGNMDVFEKRVNEFCAGFEDDQYTAVLKQGLTKLMAQRDTLKTLAAADKNAGNAAAENFVALFSEMAVGYALVRDAKLAKQKLTKPDISADDKLYYETKLALANYHLNVTLNDRVNGPHITKLSDLEIPDAGIRRQDVSIAAQYAATDLTKVALPKGLEMDDVVKARIERVNQDPATVSESEKRDMERTAAEVSKDLEERKQDPLANKVKAEVNSLGQLRKITAESPLFAIAERQNNR